MTTDDRSEDTTYAPSPEHTGPAPYTGPDPARVHHPAPDHVVPDALADTRKFWKRIPRRAKIISAVALAAFFSALIAVIVVVNAGSAPAFTGHGTLTISQSTLDSGGLSLSEAYPDITDGAQVEVVNPAGAVVGVGTLNQADVPAGQVAIDSLTYSHSEYFTFTVRNLPPGLARYGIKVGHDRGTLWESAPHLKTGVDMTLG